MSQANFYSDDPDYVSIPDNTKLGHIPGDYGLPLIGHTFTQIMDPVAFLRRQEAKYGPTFKTSMTFQKQVIALGPDAIKQVMLDSDKAFSARMGYHAPLKHFFEGGLLMRDFESHKFHRRIMQTAFKNEAMRNYVSEMNPIIDDRLQAWGGESDFHFYPHVKELLLDIGAKVFLGLDLEGPQTQKLNDAFLAMGDGTLALIRKDWPGLVYRKGLNGRRYLDDFFNKLVPTRRGKTASDMCTLFSNETTEEGELFPADIVAKHLIFLLLAAHDTTTSALTMACYFLAQRPELQQRLRDEANSVIDGDLTWDNLSDLVFTEHTFKEEQRLHPSVPAFARRTVKETELGGYTIPAHTPIMLSATHCHRMPEWWSNPDEFDPDRFAREEHKQHPFLWAPFGGGAHKCIGLHFADMLYKAVMTSLVCRYEFSLPADTELPAKIQHFPFPKVTNDLPLVLKPIGAQAKVAASVVGDSPV